ncbi:hypothetical protein [Streptomyces sp. NPDC001536]|uniref:hypothetical protein n=1 Tax=Streptomyces sp. NPDC001536 TaxID=3364583 RepID=UPI0036C0E72B
MDDQVSEGAATVFDALGTGYEQAVEGLAGQRAAGGAAVLTARLPRGARGAGPGARFELADARTYEAPPYAFDAVCAFFLLLITSQVTTATWS